MWIVVLCITIILGVRIILDVIINSGIIAILGGGEPRPYGIMLRAGINPAPTMPEEGKLARRGGPCGRPRCIGDRRYKGRKNVGRVREMYA